MQSTWDDLYLLIGSRFLVFYHCSGCAARWGGELVVAVGGSAPSQADVCGAGARGGVGACGNSLAWQEITSLTSQRGEPGRSGP